MGPYAVVDYNLTLSRLHSRLQTHLPRATLCQSRLYPLVRDLGLVSGSCLWIRIRLYVGTHASYR
jgi:hypothetical protein